MTHRTRPIIDLTIQLGWGDPGQRTPADGNPVERPKQSLNQRLCASLARGNMNRASPATGPKGVVQRERARAMPIESDGHSQGNPRLYELIEHSPKTGKSPTVWAWPQLVDYLKIAGQPVQGPWPPHQQPRPDPEEDSLPVAVPDPEGGGSRTSPDATSRSQR
jgi:hypothetical protein